MKRSILIRRNCGAAALAGSLLITACGRQEAQVPSATATAAATPAVTTPPATSPPSDPAWHYEGDTGPENWARLSAKYSACGEGRSQSPVDISHPVYGTAPGLNTSFAPAALRIVHHEHMADGLNNGHTIQINYPGADTVSLGGASYQLAQYHFHAPSEHTLDGKHFPMEMHMVHKASSGHLAVVGAFLQEGARNHAFEPVWSNLPAKKGAETHYPAVKVDVDALLPAVRTTYRYDGSLTTPPCSEGVAWIIMTTPIELSKEQIAAFTRLVSGNNRPVQPLNGRTVVKDSVTVTSAQ